MDVNMKQRHFSKTRSPRIAYEKNRLAGIDAQRSNEAAIHVHRPLIEDSGKAKVGTTHYSYIDQLELIMSSQILFSPNAKYFKCEVIRLWGGHESTGVTSSLS